jgi:inorganic pyrophosphatase
MSILENISNLVQEVSGITDSSKFLGKTVDVIMDRPMNSHHPKHGFLYPVNYGYIPNTMSPDGAELDAYVLGVDKPLDKFSGVCIAIIKRINDNDDKLIVVPKSINISDDEIRESTNFQEQYFKSNIIR